MRTARLVLATLLLAISVPATAHDTVVGGSRWCIGRTWIEGTLDLDTSLLAKIPGASSVTLAADPASEAQLSELARGVLQPYLDRTLAVSVGGSGWPLRVERVSRSGSLWQTVVRAEGFRVEPGTAVAIDYRVLLDETDGKHVNLAYLYVSDGDRESAQRVLDFSQPTWQTTFERGATRWQTMVPAFAPEAAARRDPPALPGSSGSPPAPRGPGRAARSAAAAAPARAVPDARAAPTAPLEVRPAPCPERPAPPRRPSSWVQVARFLLLGIEHILTGYDHIAFLLALIVVAPSLRAVLPIVTAFTAAHSITLLLAALRIVRLDSRIVESAIAISICWIAAENLFRREVGRRWLVTFGFGLVHGFGFASVLQDLIVGSSDLVVSVVSFNVGVELGQLLIFAVMLPVLRLIGALVDPRRMAVVASVGIGLLGCTWALERGLDLRLFPGF